MLYAIPKGTKIHCPRKRHLIGTLTRSLEPDERYSNSSNCYWFNLFTLSLKLSGDRASKNRAN